MHLPFIIYFLFSSSTGYQDSDAGKSYGKKVKRTRDGTSHCTPVTSYDPATGIDVYIYIYVYIYEYTYICIYTYIYIYIYMCKHTHISVYTYSYYR
jgi:hypothetical protein